MYSYIRPKVNLQEEEAIMGKISKSTAIQIAKDYASSNATMEDIATLYNQRYNLKIVNSKKVSNCIYYCLLYQLVNEDTEKFIVRKIAENINRHLTRKVVSQVVPARYITLLEDRNRLSLLISRLKDVNAVILLYSERDTLILELGYINSFNGEDYLSSEDERHYVPPRDEDDVLKDIYAVDRLIAEKGYSREDAGLAKASFKIQIKQILNQYKI